MLYLYFYCICICICCIYRKLFKRFAILGIFSYSPSKIIPKHISITKSLIQLIFRNYVHYCCEIALLIRGVIIA